MPDRTPCPRCRKTGFVRFENVIQGGVSERHYYCGSCTYAWVVSDDGVETQRRDGQLPPERSRTTR